MKLIKLLYLTLCFCIVSANGMEQSVIPFRIGFEFQMNGKLCEWALDNKSLQKQPVFIFSHENNELCHIELDGPDIEFVTKHFSKKEQLTLCMNSIKSVIDVTKSQLDSTNEMNFNDWLKILSKIEKVQIKTTTFFETIKERTIKKLNPNVLWEPSWQPQMTVQHPLHSTIALCNELFPNIPSMQSLIKQSTPTGILPNTALAGLMFLAAHEMVGMTNSYLMPLHTDHLLDLSMALTMYFHGQDLTTPNLLQLSINALSDTKLKELETHPLMRPLLVAIFTEDKVIQSELLSKLPMDDPFMQKALLANLNLGTFIPIANNSEFMYKAILIRDIFESYSTVHQFDAKRWTNFMSRRPFSHMFREILDGGGTAVSDEFSKSALNIKGNFLTLFNKNISFADELPSGFHLANYAEQFSDENNSPLDLSSFLEFFDPIIRDSAFLINLLKNGILCTTMFTVMNMDKEIQNVAITKTAKDLIKEVFTSKYTEISLKSIEQPKERNFLFITKESSLIKIDAKPLEGTGILLDLLSPPFLLDKSDSMGQYREGVFHSKYDPEAFGSAIVEFRNIQHAKKLKSKANDFTQAGFLTSPNFVEEETSNVFDVLSGLTSKI